MASVLVGISAHPVWIGLMLSYIFGFRLSLFPIQGYCNLKGSLEGKTAAGRSTGSTT